MEDSGLYIQKILTKREMINFQKLDFLRFLTTISVTTGARELNGTSVISLVTHNSKREMRDLDEVSSGLVRIVRILNSDAVRVVSCVASQLSKLCRNDS